MRKLLSGNEALALGAYHAGVNVAAAYPGTPSTEILENMARFGDIYTEWSTNEKVAMEVALGASYAGVRALASMKQVGLNVASDPFMAAAITGVNAGLVVISADDPGIHSSQNEQDNRHYARFAKVPLLEPADSQEAYDLMAYAFDISEQFDTPVMVRPTTRVSHSKTVVDISRQRTARPSPGFKYSTAKYVMLPVNARFRRPAVEERLHKLAAYAETFPLNRVIMGERNLGIVTSGIAFQYAREVFPAASFLKLGMTYPVPASLLRDFASRVDRLLVVEELDPFLQEIIKALGIKVSFEDFLPRIGELSSTIVAEAARAAGLLDSPAPPKFQVNIDLPRRPPLLCPGCPHTGMFFVLSSLGQRARTSGKPARESGIVITGDIGCYTLGAYPPLSAMDTCACMGASINQALGMEKAGLDKKIVAIIGDSTFMHSGITGVVNAVYNQGKITVIILDNGTTAMTGHQEHPGTGISAQGKPAQKVELESLLRGIGVRDLKIIDAFNLKELRGSLRAALDNPELSVIIVRGECAARQPKRANPRVVDAEACTQCGTCLLLGCSAIQKENERVFIDSTLCMGDACGICQQVCPHKSIVAQAEVEARK